MKKIITLLLIFISTFAFAQNDKKMERIKALRVAFISTKLDLSPEEAQKFWPIFNKFDEEQLELRKQNKLVMFKLKPQNAASVSSNEMDKLLEESELIEANLQNNRKQFVKNLKGVISPQKILQLKQLEDDFKSKLMQQIKNRKRNQNQ
ncbi:sensor of ECF-type sigma factor [Flavobacterium sp.]|uniref:sensor of ECF-type sigma factor n=1 Tax=Flavobacterium sp. TaxID=239 RepID=UPI00286AE285|nr:sensor of ECF-type sigma factor [Flavobacterium sp.]